MSDQSEPNTQPITETGLVSTTKPTGEPTGAPLAQTAPVQAHPQQYAPVPQNFTPQPQGYDAPMGALDQRVAMAEMAAISQAKSTGIAYLLWFFLGALGVHKFYLGKVGMGIAYFFTLGFLGIGLLIDLFTLPKQVRDANMLRRAQVRTQMGV